MQTQPNLNNRPILQANINQNTNSQQCHLRICPASPKIPDLLDRRKNLKLYLRPQSPPKHTSVVYTTAPSVTGTVTNHNTSNTPTST
eukprot:gene13179-9025_t